MIYLTQRQLVIGAMYGAGFNARQIGNILHVTRDTVNSCLLVVCVKFTVEGRDRAVQLERSLRSIPWGVVHSYDRRLKAA